MKNMKFGLVGAFAIAMAVFFTGCTDPCKDVVCVQGECVEGDCVCDDGYEGTDCGTALNAKFVGTYNLNENCSVSGIPAAAYAVTVAASSTGADKIVLTGLWEEAQGVANATVSSTNSSDFTIANQDFSAGGWKIDGSGTIDANGTISISYVIYDATDSSVLDDCSNGTMELQ